MQSGRRDSFSYLHSNLEQQGTLTSESHFFKDTPLLKNLEPRNLTPVVDFEKISESQFQPSGGLEVSYFIGNLKNCVKTLNSQSTSSQLFIIPNSNEKIIFKKYPQTNLIEYNKLHRLLEMADSSGIAQGSVKPKGDQNTSFNQSQEEEVYEEFKTLNIKKNGWNLMIISNNKKGSENKRCNQIINLSTYVQQSPQKSSKSVSCPVIINAVLEKGLRVLPYFTLNAYPQGIEALYKQSLDEVVCILNGHHEKVLCITALKELMHRKGLNMRFLWLILVKLKLRKSRELIMISILLRVLKKVIYSKITAKCQTDQYYNASSQDTVKETVAMFINALLKNKYAKYKPIFDETLLGLFLHRLKVISLAFILEMTQPELNYLESKEILDQVLESPSQNTTLFLNSIQTYFNIKMQTDFCRQYHQDSFILLNKTQPVAIFDFKSIEMTVVTVLTLREQAYFLLARRSANDFMQKNSSVQDLSKVFNKQQSKRVDTEKSQKDTQRQMNPQQNERIDTQPKFRNLNLSVTKSFNLIDLSQIGVKSKLPHCEVLFPSLLYKYKSTFLRDNYELSSIDQLNEWVIVVESLLKDCFSICYDNADQVLIEALLMQALVSFLVQDDDKEGVFKILQKIRSILQEAIFMSPEILSMITLVTGLWSDQSNEVELIESERNYIASMISLMSVIGDPRGRGNSGVPLMMFIAWKLQILAQAGKKTQDSELAEEMFDACLNGFVNYKLAFKKQLKQIILSQQNAESQHSQITKETQFMLQNQNEKLYFDLNKFIVRPKNVVNAGGFIKSSGKYIEESKSYKKAFTEDAELSDITIQMYPDDATNPEFEIESIPFPHWMINRQVLASQLKSLAKEKPSEQKSIFNQLVRESLNRLHPHSLLSWLITYNPIQNSRSFQWDSQTTKEFCFGQNNQMFSSSGSSYSQSGRSQNSQRFDGPITTRRRHLGSYTQIFGKDTQGIQKSEISGQVYIWGTDSSGQLGLDHYIPSQKNGLMMTQGQQLKLLHPRICIPLKDEVIKEICCGYAFTFAVNQFGRAFCWGSNECGQLGLGPESMSIPVVRCPQLNSFLFGIQKISAGNEHALALTKAGELYVWGSAKQTGLDDQDHRPIPTIIEQMTNNVKQINCGGLHSLVLTKQGQVYTWGSNEGGQLGLDAKVYENQETVTKPTLVEHLSKNNQFITQIDGGETHTVALTREHKVWGWGMSMYGQLGLGFSADSFEPGIGLSKSKVLVPTDITPFLPPNTNIEQVYCGAAFTLMRTKEGELFGCGINDLGQLGLDTYIEDMQLAMMDRSRGGHQQQMSSDVTVPSKVICFEKMNVQSIACGENHSLAVIGEDKNMLWAWGMYKNGQLGLGEVTLKMNPRPIQTLCTGHIHSIAAGSQHSVALLGEAQQLNNLTHNFFLNTDILNNPWTIDIQAIDEF